MNWHTSHLIYRPLQFATIAFAVLLAQVGWAEDIKVYRIPKETAPKNQPVLPAGHPEIAHAHGTTASPKVTFTKPEGWTESGPAEMRVLGFNITGPDGTRAQVAVTPLADMAGKEPFIVNMWRQQVGLGELSPEDAAKELTPVDVGGNPGKMFEIAGKSPGGTAIRITTVMASRGGTSWFYKLQGDDALVTAQKPEFIAFLKSVKIEEADAPATLPEGHPPIAGSTLQPSAPPVTREGGPDWIAPAGWKEVSPGSMQVAKFSVPEVGSSKADVTISVFPNSTGGTLANVNRWRTQIGLSPLEESDLTRIVKPLDESNSGAVIADLSNGSRRLVGAIVPNGGQWYFYKLLGDDAAVAPQKQAFTTFVKEVKY